MTSIEEKKSTKYSRRQHADYLAFTGKHLTKVYPNGLRLLSSNYDPIPHWFGGAQMVSLNHQTNTNPMLLNRALFETNGSCGYVLKEATITHKGRTFRRCHLHVTILSAIYLPELRTGDVIDPFVELRLFGANAYQGRHYHTKIIKNNGFNPEWNTRFRFRIAKRNLRLTFLRLRVKHNNHFASDTVVAQQMLAVEHLAEGYRSVTLNDHKNSKLELTKLFVKIEKRYI